MTEKERSRVLIMIAAFNEEDNIKDVVDNLTEHYSDYDYVVINDGSSDKTLQILRENHYHYLTLPMNLGIGGAIQTGYRYARNNGYDIAVQMDGDGQHNPRYIADLIKPLEEGTADYCVGSRFIEKEGFQSTRMRRTGIRFLSMLLHMLTGKKILDVTSGFRAVDRFFIEVFAEDYPIDYPEPKAIVDCAMRRRKIVEVPVTMNERKGGSSSINPKKSIYYMIKVTLDIIICRISYGFRR